jgi:hypothetical protein
MSTAPAPLNVEMNDDLAKQIQAALDPESLKATIVSEAQKQFAANEAANAARKAEQEAADARLAAVQQAQPPARLTHTEVIAGKEFDFEGATQAEIDAQVAAAYRVAFAIQQPQTQERVEVAPDPAAVAAAAEAEEAARVALDAQFRNGTISTAEYLEKSGAVRQYLEKEGISVDALKSTVEQTQTTQYQQSWADATNEFLNGPGADWPGGDQNREILGMKIAAMGLTDAPDKVAALAQAWAVMKHDGMFFPYQSPTPAATAQATVPAQAQVVVPAQAAPAVIAPAVPARAAATSSSLFGTSSGVAEIAPQAGATKPAEFQVPANSTPQEIMEAWKKFTVANGQDPNAAFTQTFSGRK